MQARQMIDPRSFVVLRLLKLQPQESKVRPGEYCCMRRSPLLTLDSRLCWPPLTGTCSMCWVRVLTLPWAGWLCQLLIGLLSLLCIMPQADGAAYSCSCSCSCCR